MGPVVAGFLFANGFGLALVAAAMGLGSVIAAFAILGLPLERPVDRGSAGKTARRAG